MGMIMLNGIAYTSTDGARDFPPLIYSTEEQEVGVWIDGKPLYQKTIEFNTAVTSQSADLDTGLTNISNIFICPEASYLDISRKLPVPRVHSDGSYNAGVGVTVNNGAALLNIRKGSDAGSCTPLITFRYTKTTDTPGSGKWSAFGGGTHYKYSETFSWKRGTSSATEASLTYIAPCDGWVYVWDYIANTGQTYIGIDGWIYDTNLSQYVCLDNDAGKMTHHTWTVRFPAKKGDQIQIRTRLDSGTLPTDAVFTFYG